MSEHREASDRDPVLEMFRQLPEVEVAPSEIQAMKDAVAAMRRADRHTAPTRRRRWPAWSRAAAVAAVLLTGGLLRGAAPPVMGPDAPPTADFGAAKVISSALPSAGDALAQLADYSDYAVYVSQLPLTEGFEEPVLQFHDEGLSLVFVTSENLDV